MLNNYMLHAADAVDDAVAVVQCAEWTVVIAIKIVCATFFS